MTIPYNELQNAGVDVAGLVNEKFLNNFSASHHRTNSSVYKGVENIDDFGDRIAVFFHIQNPVQFNFTPIPVNRFKPIWVSHLRIKGLSTSVKDDDVIDTPPNLMIESKKVKFDVVIYEGTSGVEKLRVSFEWDMEGRCAVYLDEQDNGFSLKLEPIKLEFIKGTSELLKEISSKLKVVSGSKVMDIFSYNIGDPQWCMKVEQLILFLLNKIISTQISNFIKEWQLPKAIDLLDGMAFSPNYLNINQDYLMVGGQFQFSRKDTSALQAYATAIIDEYSERASQEISSLSDEEFKQWDAEKSPSINWLKEKRAEVEKEAVKGLVHDKSNYEKNMALLFNSKPLDYVAKKELTISEGWEGGKKIDRIVKAEVGWWLRLDNPAGRIVKNGIQIEVTPVIGGKAQVCHFDFDPKSFGKWKCHGPCLELSLKNFRLSAFPSFTQQAVYGRVRFDSDGVNVNWCGGGFPSWANDILSWIIAMLTDPIIDFLGYVISMFRIKLISIPEHFPGTGLEWKPRINAKPSNEGPYLVFSADPEFE